MRSKTYVRTGEAAKPTPESSTAKALPSPVLRGVAGLLKMDISTALGICDGECDFNVHQLPTVAVRRLQNPERPFCAGARTVPSAQIVRIRLTTSRCASFASS